MKFKSFLLVLAMTVGSGLVASAQDRDHDRDRDNRGRWGWQDRDHDGDRDHDRDHNRNNNNNNNAAWQDGYRQGQWAASHRGNGNGHGRRWKSDADRRAYEAGYRRGMEEARNGGYNNNGPYNNGRNYPNNTYPNTYPNGNYPNNGGYGIGNARNVGYNDGLLAGQKDRSTGHSFRPTQNKGYQDADKGYNSSLGDKNQYKQVYRDGFTQGYQRGYYGR
jgi:hypothetical protein